MENYLDGVEIAERSKHFLKIRLKSWRTVHGKTPAFCVITIGNDVVNRISINHKKLLSEELGIDMQVFEYDESCDEDEIIDAIKTLNENPYFDGIVLQLHFPEKFDALRLSQTILPSKDINGFHPRNDVDSCKKTFNMTVCLGLQEILTRHKIRLFLRKVGIVGSNRKIIRHMYNTVMKNIHSNPHVVEMQFREELKAFKKSSETIRIEGNYSIVERSATSPRPRTYVFNGNLNELCDFCSECDVLITIIDTPEIIKEYMIKPKATVIDLGIFRVTRPDGETEIVGNTNFDEIITVAGKILPIPGTFEMIPQVMLMWNVLTAATFQQDKKSHYIIPYY